MTAPMTLDNPSSPIVSADYHRSILLRSFYPSGLKGSAQNRDMYRASCLESIVVGIVSNLLKICQINVLYNFF